MDRAAVLTAIHDIFSDILSDYDPSLVGESSLLSEVSPNVDSMTINELILGLEDRFEIEVPDNSLDAETRISDIIQLIEKES